MDLVNKGLKILIVTSSVYPKGGGVAYHVQNLAYELVKQGSTVEVATINSATEISEMHHDGYKITYLKDLSSLLKFILHSNYDIYHFHSYRSPPIAISIYLTKFLGKYIVFTPHAIFPAKSPYKKIITYIYDKTMGWLSLKLTNSVIALTYENKHEIISCGCKAHKITVIPNAIRFSEFLQPYERNHIKNTYNVDKYILYVGRIAMHKGLTDLVTAMDTLKKAGIKLVIIGEDYGLKKELEQIINEKKLQDTIIFTGLVDRKALISAYYDCDLFVLPSSHEGLPTVLLEAMICKKPVVISQNILNAIGTDILDYGYVWTFENCSIQSLITACESAMQYPRDSIEPNMAVLEKYSFSRVAEAISDIYFTSGKQI